MFESLKNLFCRKVPIVFTRGHIREPKDYVLDDGVTVIQGSESFYLTGKKRGTVVNYHAPKGTWLPWQKEGGSPD